MSSSGFPYAIDLRYCISVTCSSYDGRKGAPVTDEPLGSHVLELEVAEVIAETEDSRSLVFRVPDGAEIPPGRLEHAVVLDPVRQEEFTASRGREGEKLAAMRLWMEIVVRRTAQRSGY